MKNNTGITKKQPSIDLAKSTTQKGGSEMFRLLVAFKSGVKTI